MAIAKVGDDIIVCMYFNVVTAGNVKKFAYLPIYTVKLDKLSNIGWADVQNKYVAFYDPDKPITIFYKYGTVFN